MATELRYQVGAQMNITAGGYVGEDKGVTPPSALVESTSPTGEMQYTYYYSDSNSGSNSNSSKVSITAKDVWEVSVGPRNELNVKVTTTVINMQRYDIKGSPASGLGGAGRNITVIAGKGTGNEKTVANVTNDNVATAHVIAYDTGPYIQQYTIPAGEQAWRAPLYVYNRVVGYPEVLPNIDEMYCGVTIYNILPKVFPHKVVYHHQNGRSDDEVVEWKNAEECTGYNIKSSVPANPHWIFKGWSTSPDGSPDYASGQQITVCEQVDLYAIWEYTYRPGMVRHDGEWLSCDRDGETGPIGYANVRRGGKWIEMRTRAAAQGLADPPCIVHGGSWKVMKLIGKDGEPHNITWDCPHQWN